MPLTIAIPFLFQKREDVDDHGHRFLFQKREEAYGHDHAFPSRDEDAWLLKEKVVWS